jgi:hypothetical protein
MARYFFDTSALVKNYHAEAGTDAVDRLIGGAGAEILIARLTLVETIDHFICADHRLCDVAALEGLPVINPEQA